MDKPLWNKLSVIFAISIYLSLGTMVSYAQTKESYWQQYKTAKELTKQQKYQQALTILVQINAEQENFNVSILMGECYSALQDPKQALYYYKKAYNLSKNGEFVTDSKLALFGMARTELALRNGREALKYYNLLLSYDLTAEEHTLVQNNLKLSQEVLKKQDLNETIQKIQLAIEQGKGEEAYQLVKPLLDNHTAIVYLLAGNSLALMEKPQKALQYLEQALQYAQTEKNINLQRIILFQIAHMQLALKNVSKAEQIYNQLLLVKDSKTDLKSAMEGLKKTELIKQDIIFKEKLIQIQALVDKGEGRKAQHMLAPLLADHKTAQVYLLTAASNALSANPKSALTYYYLAHTYAIKENRLGLQRIALFGIARSQIALNKPEDALNTYLFILKMKLEPDQRVTAQEGINKSKKLILLKNINGYLNVGQGWKAYELILPLIKKYHQSMYYILAAQSMISPNQPIAALNFYKEAYQLALKNNEIDKQREALTGIATTQMWLDYYVRATKTYRTLLTYHLSPKEHEEAKAGLAKSLAYRNKLYAAYDEIPWNMTFTSPHMVIIALQTSLWLGQGDIAKGIYGKYQPILKKIKPGSHLYKDLKNIEWLLCQETAPYQVKPSAYYFQDTEDFQIQRYKLNARRYWSQNWQTQAALSYLNYSQYGQSIDGTSFMLNQIWKPSRFWNLSAEVTPTDLNHWSPVLWNFTGLYSPNDFITFNAITARELVEGFTAVSNNITLDSYIFGGIVQPLPYVRLVGNAYQFNFSDNNDRKGVYFFGTVTILPQMGIYTGYRLKNYTSAFQSPYYFSPDEYAENVYILGISHKIADTWRYFAEGGYGDQTIKPRPDVDAGTAPSWFYRLGLRGPITRCIYLDVQYGDYQQASAFVNTSNYRFKEAIASLSISFD